MKRVSLTVALYVLMFTSAAQADYDIFSVTDSNAVNPSNPDICGDWVVWQDDQNSSSKPDIFGYNLAEPNSIEICIFSNEQEIPAVSGRYAVWQDYRNSKRDIRAFDLQLQTEPTFTNLSLNNSFHKRYPDISGDIIVWQDYRNGDTDIYMYNIASDTETSVYEDGAETWSQYYPAIDESTVVWMDTRHGNYQIYMCTIGSSAQRVSATTENQWRPAVSGSLIVWEEIDSANNVTLVAYDIDSEGIVWTYAVPGTQANAAVSNGIIVWQEEGTGSTDYNIRAYDTSIGAYLDIAMANQDDRNPAISNRRIVWQRNGVEIVGTEIPLPTVIQVDTPFTGNMYLAESQIDISWQLESGTPPESVNIECSVNNGSDWQTVALGVSFADLHYLWEPIPDVNAIDCCQIRISDASDLTASGISSVFSIFQCDSKLTADLNGDCFVDITDFAELVFQWLVCGNLHEPDWCFE